MNRYLPSIVVILIFVSTNAFISSSVNCNWSSFEGEPSSIIPRRSSVIGHRSSVIRHPFSDLNRTEFYKALESNNRALVDSQIILLQSASGGKYEAFEGALSMKKAGFIAAAHTKLHLFKEGRKKLESAIRTDTSNTEYRFLRLVVQEHAPPFLGYNKDIEKDSEYIRKMYKSLPEDLQQAISRYNKKSKNLKLDLS
jgi:hypothetical protein